MKIVVLTQEDGFTVPGNVLQVHSIPGINVALVGVVDDKGAIVKKKSLFIKGFGYAQAAKLSMMVVFNCALDLLDRITGASFIKRPRSLRAAALRCGAKLRVISNPNAPKFLKELRAIDPDLIVSFSAPCVFKPELLSLPGLGCINLHCSLLPRYAGLLPSFWVLFHHERQTGVTVHYMDDQIDNGEILAQAVVPIMPGQSLFGLIRRTKEVGGDEICKVIRKLQVGALAALPTPRDRRSYFTWPTVDQIKSFVSSGGRLI